MSKSELIKTISGLSSGTIAVFIGCAKYTVIDHAASKAILYVATLTEDECNNVNTLEDICNIFLKANK